MSEMDDFAALKCYDYRVWYGLTDLGAFIADPVIRLTFRRLTLPVYDPATGRELNLNGSAGRGAEIELSLRDGCKALETIASVTGGYTTLKFSAIEPDAEELTFPKVYALPKVQYIPSGKFGHRAVLTFYAIPDANGVLFSKE